MFYILKSTYLYRSWFFFFLIIIFLLPFQHLICSASRSLVVKLSVVLPCIPFMNIATLTHKPSPWYSSWLSTLFMPLSCPLKNLDSCVKRTCICTFCSLLLCEWQTVLHRCKFICNSSIVTEFYGFVTFLTHNASTSIIPAFGPFC